MSKFKFLAKRIANMNHKEMMRTARIIHERTGKPTAAIMSDMISCGIKYRAGYIDYLLFEMYNVPKDKRITFVTRGKNNDYVEQMNDKSKWPLLEDKVVFMEHFSKFIHRDWLDLRSATFEEFSAFIQKHPRIVAKPNEGTCGEGIEFYDFNDKNLNPQSIHDTLHHSPAQYYIEERIEQHHEIAEIYPSSVNTVRFVTMNHSGKVWLVFTAMRIGNGGGQADNLGVGGMLVLIDPATGRISTIGADEHFHTFEKHPATGTVLKGRQIPRFKEAVALAKAAAEHIPEVGYIGWDIAITEDGVDLIEGNHFPGHDLYQFPAHLGPDQIGVAPRFDRAARNIDDTDLIEHYL